jgi:protoporphyrinogen oxidase
VYLGNYLPMTDPLYAERDEQVLERYYRALRQINPAFDPSWVTEYRIFKAPYAQPIVTVGYPDRVPPHTTPIANLYLANMSQVYPQDRGRTTASPWLTGWSTRSSRSDPRREGPVVQPS